MATFGAVGRRVVVAGAATGAGLMTLSQLVRRLGDLERLVEVVVPPAPGCPTCWTLPEIAVVYGEGVAETHAPKAPWDDGGDPVPAWPPALRCGGCGREPSTVIRIEYAEPDPGDLPIHLGDWRPGDTS